MLGGILALISAASFGLSNSVLRRGVLDGTPAQSLATTIPIGMLMFAVAVPIASAWEPLTGFSARSYIILVAAGLVHFIGNRYCISRAIKAMGSNLVGPFQEVGLLWALVLAIFFLGESLTAGKIVGTVLVLSGPVLIMGRSDKSAAAKAKPLSADTVTGAPAFVPNYRDGLIFALLSALCWGTSPILIRMAMPEGSSLATGIAAATVSYVAASVVIAVILVLPGRFAHVRSMSPQTAIWLVIAGILINSSHIFRYMALAIAPVSVVMPIQRSSVVFRLMFARVINPGYELFTPRVLLASALSLTGSLILTLMG